MMRNKNDTLKVCGSAANFVPKQRIFIHISAASPVKTISFPRRLLVAGGWWPHLQSVVKTEYNKSGQYTTTLLLGSDTRHWEVWAPTGSSHTQISLDILYLLPLIASRSPRHIPDIIFYTNWGESFLWKYALFAVGYLFSQCISTFGLTLIEMERQGNAQTSPVFVEDLENLEQCDGDIM